MRRRLEESIETGSIVQDLHIAPLRGFHCMQATSPRYPLPVRGG
jgi:hypothetical protein